MIDIKKVRDNVDAYKQICKNKNKNVDVDLLLKLDDSRREAQKKIDDMKFQQKEFAAKKDFDWAKNLKSEIQKIEIDYDKVVEEFNKLMLSMPNFYHPNTPIWENEEKNVVIKICWDIPKFDFEPKDHEELGKMRDIIDKETWAMVSWTRFAYIKWDLVLLQLAIMTFAFRILWDKDIIQKIIDQKKLNIKNTTYIPVLPPVIMKMEVMEKMWRLHPMDERYCLHDDKQVLVWSAEHTMGSMYMDKMFDENELPVRLIWYSTAFRREAWTYGKDVKGIIRVHQFDKMEMETFSTPETWEQEQELIIWMWEYMMWLLKLPYRLIECCTWDMWDIDYRHVDVETYMAGQWNYRETHTSDLMTDFQSRRLNTKFKRDSWDKEFVYMNDATAFAMWRTMIAIIENNQQKDWIIKIPDALVPYMGKEYIWK